MTPLGLIFVVVTAVFLIVGRGAGAARLVSVTAGLPIGVVLVVGGEALTAFYAVAIGVVIAQVWTFLTKRADPAVGPDLTRSAAPRPGFKLLVFFALWSTFVTLVAPTLFHGTPVLVSRGGLDEQLAHPGALQYSVSNLAQIVYTLLGVAVLLFIARSRAGTPGFVSIGLGVVTVLSFWRLISQLAPIPYPEGLFDNSPNVKIIETTAEGDTRFRGIYSEPSSLGSGALTAMVYFATQLPHVVGWRRLLSVAILIMASVNGVVSDSATFLAAGLAVLALMSAVAIGGFVLNRARVQPVVVALICAAVGGAAFLLPAFSGLVDRVLSEKVASTSYASRTGGDLFSLRLLLQTWGFGVGLGSNRPSSLIPSALSRVGIPGALAFFGLIVTAVVRVWPQRAYRPTAWAFLATIVSRLMAGPGLLEPFMALSLGVLLGAVWRANEQDADDSSTGMTYADDRPLTRPASVSS